MSKILIALAVCFLFLPVTYGQLAKITTEELRNHVFFLASDSLKGRYPGDPEDKIAVEYIKKHFLASKLLMQPQNGLQAFNVVTGIAPGTNNSFRFNRFKGDLGSDFTPMAFSSNYSLKAEVAYLGYGLSISNDKVSWDDYHGIDVTGRWVMILRGEPNLKKTGRMLNSISDDFGKAVLAKDKGAKGVILVNPVSTEKEDKLESLARFTGDAGIPVIQITRETADRLLRRNNENIQSLENYHTENSRPRSFGLKNKLYASVELKEIKIETYNVIGFLQGQHPGLKDEYIVVGAHYDHLGMGGPGTGTRRPDIRAIHVGADDNASGVAAMIEIAEKLASVNDLLDRSIIFIAFGAEEKGLLGSKYFVNNPPVDISNIKLMINLDMLGRMREGNTVQLGGTGTAKEMEELIAQTVKNHNLNLAMFPEGLGPSDHASFYGQEIPVLFFTSGPHMDYHTPEDTPDKINFEGIKIISDAVAELVKQASQYSQNITFTEAGPKTAAPRHVGRGRVSLGFMPDFTARGIEGARVDIVTKGRPAYRGGMQNGDIITAINGYPVKNIEEYMFRLSQLEPGQTINVEVLRNEQKELLLIVLD